MRVSFLRLSSKVIALFFAMSIFICCKAVAQKSNTDTIRIGYFYYLDSAKVSPIVKMMGDKLDMEMVAKRYVDNDSIVADLKRNKIDLFYFNSFGYILVKDEITDMEPLLVAGDEKDGASVYKSVVITSKDNAIASLEELKSKESIKVSFGQPLSTSSHLVPRAYMKKIGLDPMFSNERFETKQVDVINAVIDGTSEIGACGLHVLYREQLQDKVKILWTSNDIPQGPWVANKNSLAKVKPILELLETLHATDPESFQFMKKNWGIPVSTKFVPASDQIYDGLRDTFSSVDELKVMLDFFFLEAAGL